MIDFKVKKQSFWSYGFEVLRVILCLSISILLLLSTGTTQVVDYVSRDFRPPSDIIPSTFAPDLSKSSIFLATILLKYTGPVWTLFCGSCLYFVGQFVLYLSLSRRLLDPTNSAISAGTTFIGFGNAFFYTLGLIIPIQMCLTSRHFGKLVGILHSIYFFSPMFCVISYYTYLDYSPLKLYLFVSVPTFVVIIFGYIIFWLFYKENKNFKRNVFIVKGNNIKLHEKEHDITFKDLLMNCDFWIFLIIFSLLLSCISYVVDSFPWITNISIGVSDRTKQHQWPVLAAVGYFSSLVVSFFFGSLVDCIRPFYIRFYLVTITICALVDHIFLIFFQNQIIFWGFSYILNCLLLGIFYVLWPFYVANLYGLKNFAQNFGIFSLVIFLVKGIVRGELKLTLSSSSYMFGYVVTSCGLLICLILVICKIRVTNVEKKIK